MHKSGSKKEPNPYISQKEVFPVQDVFYCSIRKLLLQETLCIHLEGTGRYSYNMTDETHKEMLQVCCVYCILYLH